MFGLASGIYQSYFSTPELNVLLLGDESVGKTALLERIKVTQFSHRVSANATTNATGTNMVHNFGTSTSTSTSSEAPTRSNRIFSCPALSPSRYADAKVMDNENCYNQEEEADARKDYHVHDHYEEDAINNPNHVNGNNSKSTKSNSWLNEKQHSSLEDVSDWTHSSDTIFSHAHHSQHDEDNNSHSNKNNQDHDHQQDSEYNLKPGCKMLPLEKIRPTRGQNLAKIPICGAKCHIFDISGKFQNLWDRYYGDADAVIFCWRLDSKQNYDNQRSILETVRREIPDDVPMLIFGHAFDRKEEEEEEAHNVMNPLSYAITTFVQSTNSTQLPTELFLPNYHSNLMHAVYGSAKTGQGIREAMEWLIPLAKRQAKLRIPASSLPSQQQQPYSSPSTLTERQAVGVGTGES